MLNDLNDVLRIAFVVSRAWVSGSNFFDVHTL